MLAAPWGFALGSVPAELGKRSFTLPYKSPGYFEAAAVGTQWAQNPSHLPGPLLEEEPVLPPARRRCPPSAAARTRSTFFVIGYAAAGEGTAAERPFRRLASP